MSAANAANAQARRPVAPSRPAAPPVARAAAPDRSPSALGAGARELPPAAVAVAGFDDHDDEFRLNLSDIPRMQESLDVEGLKPTLLSRLLDIVMPIKP